VNFLDQDRLDVDTFLDMCGAVDAAEREAENDG
jgi:hypothetical protein